jgi:nicotinate-nucleotide adenylyltransferase
MPPQPWPKSYDEAMQQASSDELLSRHGSRVAFFGGSFDPPHLGHLAVARAARDAFHLDTVFFAPVGNQPLKPEGSAASFEDRVAMTRLAIEGEPSFAISLGDAPRPSGSDAFSPNYTIETLERLRATLGSDSTLYCLMGADSFFGLRRWHRAAEIPLLATLIVASRPGQPLESICQALPSGMTVKSAPDGDRMESGIEIRTFLLANPAGHRAPLYILPGLDVEISASEIRSGIRGGRNAATDAPSGGPVLSPRVADYIRSHHLYC